MLWNVMKKVLENNSEVDFVLRSKANKNSIHWIMLSIIDIIIDSLDSLIPVIRIIHAMIAIVIIIITVLIIKYKLN